MLDSSRNRFDLRESFEWNVQDSLMAYVIDDLQLVIEEFRAGRFKTEAINEALNCIVDAFIIIDDETIKNELITIHKYLEEIRQNKVGVISLSTLNEIILKSKFFRQFHLRKNLNHISILAREGHKSLLMKTSHSVSYRFVLPDELDAALCMYRTIVDDLIIGDNSHFIPYIQLEVEDLVCEELNLLRDLLESVKKFLRYHVVGLVDIGN